MRHKHSVTEDPVKLTGIVAIAAAVGAGVAMLFTPRDGGQVRRGLKRRANHLKDEVQDHFDANKDEVETVAKDAKTRLQTTANKVAQDAKSTVAKVKEDTKATTEDAKDAAKPTTPPRDPRL